MRKLIVLIVGIVGIVVFGELFAKYYLGLGDPPLVIGDCEIDYLFAPNQNCIRFGNRIVYNNVSMRCDFNVDGGVCMDRGGGGRYLL